jgi:hypothetical protein
MKIIEKEFNVSTGEETITEREATPAEKKIREKFELEIAEIESKKIQREAIAQRLGLTIDELQVLLG